MRISVQTLLRNKFWKFVFLTLALVKVLHMQLLRLGCIHLHLQQHCELQSRTLFNISPGNAPYHSSRVLSLRLERWGRGSSAPLEPF